MKNTMSRILWKKMVYDEIETPDGLIGVISFRSNLSADEVRDRLGKLILKYYPIMKFFGVEIDGDERISKMFIDHIMGKTVYFISNKTIMFSISKDRPDTFYHREWFARRVFSQLFYNPLSLDDEIDLNLRYKDALHMMISDGLSQKEISEMDFYF